MPLRFADGVRAPWWRGMIRAVTSLLVVAVLLILFALVSGKLRGAPLTAPMVFVAAGVLLGPNGTDTVHGDAAAEAFRFVLEAALVLVLFTDAASLATFTREEDRVPIRLLGIGLPLSIGLGWLIATLVFPDMPLWEAALLGAVLAPTDAALGEAVIADPRVPRLIRDALNVESGLNDGLALPFVTVFMALAAEEMHAGQLGVGDVILRSVVLSPVIGAAIGAVGAWALARASARGWTTQTWGQIAVGAVAFAAYAATVQVEGSGFIGAWVAGFAAGKVGAATIHDHGELTEQLGHLLATIGFFGFGFLFLGPSLADLGWKALAYAALSLTVVRLVPVGVALVGTGLRRPTVGYVGWFGPRGLASIVFMLLVVEEGAATGTFVLAVTTTIAFSVYLHGATALAGASRYGAWFARASSTDPALVEGSAIDRPPARRRITDDPSQR